MKQLKLLVVPLILGGIGIAVWWPGGDQKETTTVHAAHYGLEAQVIGQKRIPSEIGHMPAPVEEDKVAATPSAAWTGTAVPSVLEGTDIDGVLEVDAEGNLKVSLGVKDFFDYFLSAVGELSPDEAIAQVQSQLQQRLPPAAAMQAMHLLNDYLDYQRHLAEMMARQLIPADQQNYGYYAQEMEETFSEVRNLRRQYLSPAAVEAFFGMEEMYSEYAVESIKIRADASLSDEAKQDRIAALDARMPAQMREQAETSRVRSQAASNAQSMYDQGWAPEAVRTLLQEHFAEEEADQILGFYARESAWNKRLDQYLARKRSLEAGAMDEQTRQNQLNRIRSEMFASEELARVLADEAIAEKTAQLALQDKRSGDAGS